ncbi:phage tail tape measure protein [Agrobacterium genomosp. 3 str. RTP8]|uniref:phage tail tape measure protein n=1 Tax=Agrobacterium tomkonis TaxID=1183410 RepID=UPI001CD9F664|nr:phage tail tape measure protein [Agrobacterium tomkonis RTP8]
MSGRTLSSSLVVRLIDQVTAPAKKVGGSLLGLNKAAERATTGFGGRLSAALERNNAALADARGGVIDAVAGFYAFRSAIGAVVGPTIALEEKLADLRKVANVDDAGMKALEAAVKRVSAAVSRSQSEVAATMAAAAQAGIAVGDLESYAEMVLKVGVAWDVTGDQAGEALAKIGTAMGWTVDQTRQFADEINVLSDSTAASSTDLLEYARRTLAMGKAAGFSSKEALALGSAMISAGAQPDVAATSFLNLTRALTKGASATRTQQAAFKALGLDAKKLAKGMQKDALGTTMAVLEAIQKAPAENRVSLISQIFGDEARALGPILENLGLLRENYAAIADEAKTAGSVQREFGVRAKTTANALARLRNAFEAIAIALGSAITPALADLADKLVPIAGKIADLVGKYPRLTSAIVGTTGALIGFRIALSGLRFIGLLGKGGALSALAFGFNGISRAAAGMGGGIRRIREVVALQNALGAAQMGRALTGWEKFGTVFRAVTAAGGRLVWTLTKLSFVGLAIGAAATFIYNNWQNLMNFFSGFAEGFSKAFEGVGPTLQPIVSGFGDLFKWVSGLLGPIEDTNGAFKSWGETVGGVVAGAVNSVVGAIERLINGIRSAVEWAVSLKEKLGGLMTWGSGDGSVEIPSYDAMGNPTGHRATGGPVWPGGSFVVGDGGEPEIFTPKTAGTITPMSKAGGNISIGPFTFNGISGDVADLEARVRRAVSDGVDQLLRGSHVDSGAYS